MIECPFCGEKDFDLIGLKAHLLNGDCEDFAHTLSPLEEARRREEQSDAGSWDEYRHIKERRKL